MITLNQISSDIASNLGQPFNHELKERIKDIVKAEFATYIRQSIERHGIDDQLILSYISEVEEITKAGLPITEDIKIHKFRTKNKVPATVRYSRDSPFIFVGSVDEGISYPYRDIRTNYYSSFFFSNGKITTYHLENGYIFIESLHPINFKAKYIKIKDIFESPEQILSMYDNNDGQDIQLPLPIDIITIFRDKVIKIVGAVIQNDVNVTNNG
jgi:hypothetical protein